MEYSILSLYSMEYSFFILYGVFVQSFELVAFSSMGLINRLNPHTPYRAKAPPTRAPYGHGSVDNKDYG